MHSVSVIIPAYNADGFIDDAVTSALGQTARPLEVIVVDDGSTDSTRDRLLQYGSRITVHAQANQGVACARNAGARLASGDWLAFLDADDVWAPEKLARQLASADGPFIYSDRHNIGERGDLPLVQSEVTPMFDGDIFLALLMRGNFITASSTLVRRDVFFDVGGFFHELHGTEDWDLWLRLASRFPVSLVREPLVSYRFHAGGISRNYQRMWAQREKVIVRAFASAKGLELDWTMRRRIWAQTWLTNAWEAGQAGDRGQARIAYQKALAWWPLDVRAYRETVKLCLPAGASLFERRHETSAGRS
jgi:glycosyltransferase involved in cell wall biosynthesis